MSMDEKYPLALPEGTILAGQYVIEKVLGQGGFGITYRATDHKTNQKVAVKEFFPDTLAYRERTTVISYPGERSENYAYGKESFLQEAKTLAEFIGNANIVRIHSYFEENGTAYFVMDYIEGKSFDEYIKEKGGKINVEEAKNILVPVMDALGVVHSKGIVHRDVTPDNIYITSDGTVKLLDFGAARYSLGDKSRSLDVILKHGFAPKEQYTRRGKQGAFTDIYSLGATFYFAITGKRPPDSVDRLDEDDLIPPSNLGVSITDYQERAILQALNVQPAERFQTMAEFKKILLNESTVTNQIFFTAPDADAVPPADQALHAAQQIPPTLQQADQSVHMVQAAQPKQTNQPVPPAQKPEIMKNKKLIIGLSAACGVFALVAAFLFGRALSDKNDVTTSDSGSVNQKDNSQPFGNYVADNTTMPTLGPDIPELDTLEFDTPEPFTPEPATPEPTIPGPVTYSASELRIVGNRPANIKNMGIATLYNDAGYFGINNDFHSLFLYNEQGDIEKTFYDGYQGEFSCLSSYDGMLYFIYDGWAYMKNVEEDLDEYLDELLIPELEKYGGDIESLYVTTGCYFVCTDEKMYRVSRKTGEEEEWISIVPSRDTSSSFNIPFFFDIAFGDDGWIYYTCINSEGISSIYKIAADDFSYRDSGVVFNRGYCSDPVVDGDYVYVLYRNDSYTSIAKINTDLSLVDIETEWDISDYVNGGGQNSGNYAFGLNIIDNHHFFSVYDASGDSILLYHAKDNNNVDDYYETLKAIGNDGDDRVFTSVFKYGGKYQANYIKHNDEKAALYFTSYTK